MLPPGRSEDLQLAWEGFRHVLGLYGKNLESLNEGCSAAAIAEVEAGLGIQLPPSLVQLLQLANGQKKDTPGIFKSVSGWDVYCRHAFLDLEGIAAAYRRFVEYELLLTEFGPSEVPFTADQVKGLHSEAFTVDLRDGRVSLIWTEAADPWLPPEWQVLRFTRGANLAEFLRVQTWMYW
ncbi:MAG TPA: SMI1/KNR4 family protein [Thermoanaerobaculia bacterium]|nr:SMI1/KNR4 family protein [Thermoanaerobaculia bacterium]